MNREVTDAVVRFIEAGTKKNGGLDVLGDVGLVLEEPVFLKLCQEHGRAAEMLVVVTSQGRTVVTCKGVT